MTTSLAFVIQGNIERYRRLIGEERDAARRDTISKLLAEAEADLRAMQKMQKRQSANGSRAESSASHSGQK